jgi:hypothetical protein
LCERFDGVINSQKVEHAGEFPLFGHVVIRAERACIRKHCHGTKCHNLMIENGIELSKGRVSAGL